ncbi:MAG: hypothetical protein ACE5IH_04480 [Thermodesulfobacteriota bacterium]
MKRSLLIALVAGGFVLLLAAPSMAVHKGAGDLTCGACHTMHNSQGRDELNTTGDGAAGTTALGSLLLLRAPVTSRAEIHMLCLQCHSTDGVQATVNQQPHNNPAPKVHIVTADPDGLDVWDETQSWEKIGAGGNFYPEIGAGPTFTMKGTHTSGGGLGNVVGLGKGHSIGLPSPTPPGGDQAITGGFSCTSCHDPHGTAGACSVPSNRVNRYRNLKALPDAGPISGNNGDVCLDTATHTSWIGGVTGPYAGGGTPGANYYVPETITVGAVTATIWPVSRLAPTGVPATDATNGSNSYGTGATVTSAGISRWCAQCHDDWHEDISTANETTYGPAADWARHPVDNGLNDGSPNSGAGIDIIRLNNYEPAIAGQVLPVALSSAVTTDRVFYIPNKASLTLDVERVMCLTCHMVHGGPYYDNLRWDYQTAVGIGSQTGNAIPSTKGCQLCHNR